MLHIDLKQLMEDACFACLGKLLQTSAPPYEKHFCPFDVFSLVSVHYGLWDEEFEFLVKRSVKDWGANLGGVYTRDNSPDKYLSA